LITFMNDLQQGLCRQLHSLLINLLYLDVLYDLIRESVSIFELPLKAGAHSFI
jgi:hypothetical protein